MTPIKKTNRIFLSFIFIISIALNFFSESVQAASTAERSGPFGVGLVFGDPTGFTGKYDVDSVHAIDGGLSFDFNRWVFLYGDWLYHFRGSFSRYDSSLSDVTPYIGIGGILISSNDSDLAIRSERYFSDSSSSKFALGVRVPVGIEWRTPQIPLGVFAEIAPGMTVIPATYGFIQIGIGARYFF